MRIGFLSILGILVSMTLQAQEQDNSNDLIYAKQLLEFVLDNSNEQSRTNVKLIPKAENAISYAEIILFELYGKENIEAQKPYKINQINDYWVIIGSLPKEKIGGVFNIILNAWNGKVLTVEHGK